jgi:hypothetical protein
MAGVAILPTSVVASDHIDSPIVTQERGADIADLWAFLGHTGFVYPSLYRIRRAFRHGDF